MENGKKRLGGVYMAAIHTQEGTVYYEKTRNRWRCDYKILDPDTSKFIRKTKTFKVLRRIFEKIGKRHRKDLLIKVNR